MKTKLLTIAIMGFLFQIPIFGQDITRVNATSNEVSDNLDLRAVASIFGEARDLQDFERRLNDPQNKISNLDLNFDRQVDYLRVIEAVEKNTHLIILQAVLERDVFQDVATIEVERDRHNQVQIQVVGDVFMYGPNYIYEPIYVVRPAIYNVFWVRNYNPYCSPYYYNYYPTYYYAWTPFPVYRYRRNVHVHINEYNYYNYSDNRRSSRATAMHQTRRSNGYEKNYQGQANTSRNNGTQRSNLNNSGRRVENAGSRNYSIADNSLRSAGATIRNATPTRSVRSSELNVTDRSNATRNSVRLNNTDASVRTTNAISNTRNTTPSSSIRSTNRSETTRSTNNVAPVRSQAQNSGATRNASPRQDTRSSSSRGNSNSSVRSKGR